MVKKGDKPLQDKLNAGLAAIRADGSYGEIYKSGLPRNTRHADRCRWACHALRPRLRPFCWGLMVPVGGAPNANYGRVMEPELWFGWFGQTFWWSTASCFGAVR